VLPQGDPGRTGIDTGDNTMSISMHSASAPIFLRLLRNMLNWLDKAEAHAQARSFDPANYLGLRLAPDMFPLSRQIQIASDAAKGCMARLAGQEPPKWADDETTLEDLRARIRKTMDYVASFQAAQIDGSEAREIQLVKRNGDVLRYQGEEYLKHNAMPNFYFHATTLYALLRHAGVPVGKGDYLGG
jgi:hypothetical protein